MAPRRRPDAPRSFSRPNPPGVNDRAAPPRSWTRPFRGICPERARYAALARLVWWGNEPRQRCGASRRGGTTPSRLCRISRAAADASLRPAAHLSRQGEEAGRRRMGHHDCRPSVTSPRAALSKLGDSTRTRVANLVHAVDNRGVPLPRIASEWPSQAATLFLLSCRSRRFRCRRASMSVEGKNDRPAAGR